MAHRCHTPPSCILRVTGPTMWMMNGASTLRSCQCCKRDGTRDERHTCESSCVRERSRCPFSLNACSARQLPRGQASTYSTPGAYRCVQRGGLPYSFKSCSSEPMRKMYRMRHNRSVFLHDDCTNSRTRQKGLSLLPRRCGAAHYSRLDRSNFYRVPTLAWPILPSHNPYSRQITYRVGPHGRHVWFMANSTGPTGPSGTWTALP